MQDALIYFEIEVSNILSICIHHTKEKKNEVKHKYSSEKSRYLLFIRKVFNVPIHTSMISRKMCI